MKSKKLKHNNKSFLYKKKIDYVEKTYNDKWEIQEQKEKAHFIETQTNFLKFFFIANDLIKKLSTWELKTLLLVFNCCNYWNDVFLSDLQRAKIINNNSLKVYLTRLFKKKILYKTDIKGLYKLNPQYAYKWDTTTYRLLIDNL